MEIGNNIARASVHEQLQFIQNGRVTRRFHGLRMHDQQRVDSHSYGVAVLVLALIRGNDYERRERLMRAALMHDLAEWKAGDIPAPTKRDLGPEWRKQFNDYEDGLLWLHGLEINLSERDKRVLKLADAAEGCLHCIEERLMGNMTIGPIFLEFWKYLEQEQEITNHPEYHELGEQDIHDYIMDKWRAANGGSWL